MSLKENPSTPVTKFFADRWTIRVYRNGIYDAASNVGPGLSPGFDTFDEAVEWVCEQEAARAILEHDATQAKPDEAAELLTAARFAKLTRPQADLLYGMATRYVYEHPSSDPAWGEAVKARNALYPLTTAAEEDQAAAALLDLGPGVGGGNPHTLDIAHAEAAKRERTVRGFSQERLERLYDDVSRELVERRRAGASATVVHKLTSERGIYAAELDRREREQGRG